MIIFENTDCLVLKCGRKGGGERVHDKPEKVMIFLWRKFYVPLVLASFALHMTPEAVALPVEHGGFSHDVILRS
jgi:hypothetical protein